MLSLVVVIIRSTRAWAKPPMVDVRQTVPSPLRRLIDRGELASDVMTEPDHTAALSAICQQIESTLSDVGALYGQSGAPEYPSTDHEMFAYNVMSLAGRLSNALCKPDVGGIDPLYARHKLELLQAVLDRVNEFLRQLDA